MDTSLSPGVLWVPPFESWSHRMGRDGFFFRTERICEPKKAYGCPAMVFSGTTNNVCVLLDNIYLGHIVELVAVEHVSCYWNETIGPRQ